MYGDDPREPPFDYDYQPQPEPRKRYGGYVIGALALAMFLGGIWVAYHQGVEKGVLRAPPLIKAEQGPTKVPPENPGGMRVPNQDKTIYDHMDAAAGNGAATTAGSQPVERLLPPPEEPAPGTPAPATPVAAASPPASTTAAQSPAAPTTATPPPAASGTAAATTTGQSAAAAAGPANSAATSSAPVPLLPPQPPANPSANPSAPMAAKAEIGTAAAPEPRTPPAHPAAEREQAMARSGVRIQLGAYRDQGAAQKDWQRLVKRYPDVLRRLHPEVTAINLGSRGTFQRLQAGPLPSRAAADEACAKLKAQKQGCIVVAH